MRAAYADWLPDFAHLFHIRPWEMDLLTWAEAEKFTDWVNERR